MQPAELLPLLVILPFAAALSVGLLARFARRISGLGMLLAIVPALVLGSTASGSLSVADTRWSADWIPELGITLAFHGDALSTAFVLLIGAIGLVVFPYAGAYVGPDPRFFSTLLVFMGSMLGIVLADDLVLVFVFWEMTSISSFLLISHRSESPDARLAAQQALLVTVLGGLGLLAAGGIIGSIAGTTRLTLIGAPLSDSPLAVAVSVLIAIAAVTKSAQVPFHFWLPNAMEAPTPVSAYLHSATMVQAGIYLLARMSPIVSSPGYVAAMTGIGLATIVVGTVSALRQRDAKRMLAYSTISALGMLTVTVAQGAWSAFYALVLAHGLYKAAMFLIAGVLEKLGGTRDLVALRGLGSRSRVLQIAGLLAAVSMAGLPIGLGYLAKEAMQHGAAPVLSISSTIYGIGSVAVAFIVGVRPFLGAPTTEERGTPRNLAPVLTLSALAPALFGIVGTAAGVRLGSMFGGEPWAWAVPSALSWGTWIVGAGLAASWIRLVPTPTRPLADRIFGLTLSTAAWAAGDVSKRIQHGYLNGYIRAVFGTLVILVGLGLTRMLPAALPANFGHVSLLELAVVAVMIVGGLAAVLSPSRLGAVAALGLVGYGVALIYVEFGAPDLAMTQIAVETLTLILFVFTFRRLPKSPGRRNLAPRVRDGIVAACVGITMTILTIVGYGIPNDATLSSFYAEKAYPLGRGHNVVSVILTDFRGFDTLGEITVLGVSALGVFALLRMPRRGGKPSPPSS